MIYLKYGLGGSFILTPLPMVALTFFLLGINFILIGIIAQIIIAKDEGNKQDINQSYIEEIIDNRK